MLHVGRSPFRVSLTCLRIHPNYSPRAKHRIPGGVNSPVRAFRGLDREPFFVDRAAGATIWDVDGKRIHRLRRNVGPGDPRPRAESCGRCGPRSGDATASASASRIRSKWRWRSSSAARCLRSRKSGWSTAGRRRRCRASALRAASPGADKIIKFEGCYHGHVDSLLVNAGSGALTHGQPDSAGIPAEFAALTISLPFNNIEAVRAAFRENKGEIAAIILEPVPANAGLYLPGENFLEALARRMHARRRAPDL